MGWGTNDDFEIDDNFEIDLTADAPDGLLPIRWVGPPRPATGADPDHTKGNGHTNGHTNGDGHTNGSGNGVAAVRTRPVHVPRVVTLASFMAQPPAPRESPPIITLREVDEWRDALQPVTLRDVATSRGARFLTFVAVTVLAMLMGAIVLLWQRVEARPTVLVPTEAAEGALTPADLREVKTRLNGLETRFQALLDPTGSVITTSPNATQQELDELVYCINAFQQAIASGLLRGGVFNYCR